MNKASIRRLFLRRALLMAIVVTTPLRHGLCELRAQQPPGPCDHAENIPGPVRLVLPPTIYAVVGQEMNVYFDNVTLTLNPDNYAFDVSCARGRQQADCWTYTPAAEDVGTVPFQLEIRNEQNEVLARACCTLRVTAPQGEAKPVSLLAIGDSLTH